MVERLLPHPVARQHQPAADRIPDRQGEHPAERVQESQIVLLVEMDDGLDVAPRGETMPPCQQLVPQLDVVVDLAVAHDSDLACLVEDGLMSASQVDDAESAHGESDV